jgi:hypothetical protein
MIAARVRCGFAGEHGAVVIEQGVAAGLGRQPAAERAAEAAAAAKAAKYKAPNK